MDNLIDFFSVFTKMKLKCSDEQSLKGDPTFHILKISNFYFDFYYHSTLVLRITNNLGIIIIW